MSNYDINSNFELVKTMIGEHKRVETKYKNENPCSVIGEFEKELKKIGFDFSVSSQIRNYLPKYKESIIPLAIKYYKNANTDVEKRYFLLLFHLKGLEEIVPMLLKDFHSSNISRNIKGMITENIRVIHSSNYISDYLKIVENNEWGDIRNPIIVLLGDLKIKEAIPMLIAALDEGKNITTNALAALGKFELKELKPYFERFLTHKNRYYRREAQRALAKIE